MNTYLTAWVATERQQELLGDAAESRRSGTDRKAKAGRGHARPRRLPSARRRLAAA
jgi:hypothetical protein